VLYRGKRFFTFFKCSSHTKKERKSFKNCSLKGYFGYPKCYLYGIVKTPFWNLYLKKCSWKEKWYCLTNIFNKLTWKLCIVLSVKGIQIICHRFCVGLVIHLYREIWYDELCLILPRFIYRSVHCRINN